ncbi:MAG: leucyl aminopeptidase family protein [Phycisphaerales bacterium]
MFQTIKHRRGRSSIVVVGVRQQDKKKLVPAAARGVDAVTQALRDPAFKADNGEVCSAGPRHVLLGLGDADAITPETLRTAGAGLLRGLHRREVASARLELGLPASGGREGAQRAGRAFGEGLAIASWKFTAFEGSAAKKNRMLRSLEISADDRDFDAGLERGLLLGEAVNTARTLGATPPNVCNPPWIAAQAKALARRCGLRCSVITHAQAKRMGMGGLVAVGHGSDSKSCLVHLTHKPRRIAPAARGKRLVLVGKTLTYDTGGYSLKVNNGMKGMKYDKLGGMAVIGAMEAIARLKLPIEVHALLAAAENMVSGDSMRPDDIITMYNGVTVEITNTDAEGRLVLGDALAYAQKDLRATALVDVATLTGGVVVALGHFCAGFFANDDAMAHAVESAAGSSGEKVWRLPLWTEHREFMRSSHADILNSNPLRNAHPVQGAAFLSYFVDSKTPWAHLDIAGVGDAQRGGDLFPAGPTGFGVRLLVDLVEAQSQKAK